MSFVCFLSCHSRVQENLSDEESHEVDFCRSIVLSILKHVTSQTSSLNNEVDRSSREKQLLEAYSFLLRKLLDDNVLQVSALDQVVQFADNQPGTHCCLCLAPYLRLLVAFLFQARVEKYLHSFFCVTGLLQRLLSHLWALKVITRGAFIAWEEDEEDTTPGKEQAVSQVAALLDTVRASPK